MYSSRLIDAPYDDKNGRACTFYKKRRAEGLYWQLAPMPSVDADQADGVYNGDNYYKGFKPKTNESTTDMCSYLTSLFVCVQDSTTIEKESTSDAVTPFGLLSKLAWHFC